MAEYSTPEERTEMPTDRRMGELRKQGSIFYSNETVQCVSLYVGYKMLTALWGSLNEDMKYVFVKSFSLIGSKEPFSAEQLRDGFIGLLVLMGPEVFALVFVTAIAASLAVMLQTKWNVKPQKVEFKWSNLNPVNGIKRIFSVAGVVTTAKALAKLVVILPIGFFVLQDFAPQMVMLPFMPLQQIFVFTSSAVGIVFWRIFYVLIALAIFDFTYGKWKWLRDVKMTKDEVKDERKAVEGDETTKRKIISKGLQRAAQRIASSVRKADVVITNPTHFAVALQYDRMKMKAPIVVAKGQDELALRIKEIAKEAGVPVLERKTLARALYASARVGSEIPYELFRAVAEVLAYVYRLKNPYARAGAK